MFYVQRKNQVTGAWETVCGYSRYESAENFIQDMLNRSPVGRAYKIEKVYERE